MNEAERYAQIIMRDDRGSIVSETPTIFEADHIVRVYEFEDGAVVNYEWQAEPGSSAADRFNHKFTLEKLPDPNILKLRKGIIKVIDY